MKKLFISVSVMLNLAFFIVACSKMDAPAPQTAGTGRYTTDGSSTMSSAVNGGKYYGGLTFRDVVKMINNYGDNQAKVIEQQMGIEDARSCWFSVAEIKRFITHLEADVLQNGSLDANGLGIRFYYGAHDKMPTLAGTPASYGMHHNLVMIPTYSDKGSNIDFNPYQLNAQTRKPLPLGLMEEGKKMTRITIDNAGEDDSSFSMNHGHLYPPYKP